MMTGPTGESSSEERPRAADRVTAAIDRVNGWVGRFVAWLVVAMVFVGAFNAVARYLGRYIGVNLSSNAYLELQWYLFSLVFLLGAAFALRENAHVRVDVLYARASERTRRWIDLLGTLLLLLPFTLFTFWISLPAVRASWRVREGSPDPGGLPRYPIKTVILIGFALLALQGVAELIKLRRAGGHGRPSAAPGDRAHPPAEGI